MANGFGIPVDFTVPDYWGSGEGFGIPQMPPRAYPGIHPGISPDITDIPVAPSYRPPTGGFFVPGWGIAPPAARVRPPLIEGGPLPPHVAHPGISPDITEIPPTPPPEAGGGDIGPGIPLTPGEPVTSVDLAPRSRAEDLWAAIARNRGGAGRIVAPLVGFPASQRYSSTRPEFIYTNPAAAQQAAANYAARLGFESSQDQGYRDYLARVTAEQGAAERAQQQIDATRALQEAQLENIRGEGSAARASAERIARSDQLTRAYNIALQKWERNEQYAKIAEANANSLNSVKPGEIDPNIKPLPGFVQKVGPKWVPVFTHQPPPLNPFSGEATGKPIEGGTIGGGAEAVTPPVTAPSAETEFVTPPAPEGGAAAAATTPAPSFSERLLRSIWPGIVAGASGAGGLP